jgi:hypothetical protein
MNQIRSTLMVTLVFTLVFVGCLKSPNQKAIDFCVTTRLPFPVCLPLDNILVIWASFWR